MRAYFRQLASESVVYGLAGIAARFVSVFLVPVYTRVFTPAEYGQVGLVNAAMAMVTIFVVLGLDNSAHRWYWDTEEVDDRRATLASWAWCQGAVSTVFAVALFAAAPLIARVLLNEPGAGPLLRVAAWSLPLGTLGTVATNWFRMRRRPWVMLAYSVVTMLLGVGLSVWFVVGLRRGARGVFEAQVVLAAATSLIAVALLRGWVSPAAVRAGRLREMLRYALPLIPAAVAYWVVSMVDRIFVQRYASTAELGLYQVGSMVAAVVALATSAFQQAWGPFSLSIHRQPDARRFYAFALLVYLWGATLLAAGVSLFAPEILRLAATPAYRGGATVVPMLTFSFVMIGASYVAAVGPSIARRTGPVGAGVTVAAVLNVALNFVLTPRFGKEGSAAATLVAQAVVSVYIFRASQQLYPIPYRFGAALGLLAFAGTIVAGATWVGVPQGWGGVAVKGALLALWIPAGLVFGVGGAAPRQLLGRVLRPAASGG